MIHVTKTYLPSIEEYTAVLKRAWDHNWVTNNGELLKELEQKLRDYLGTEFLLFCSNGTVVLQMALKALHITKEVITTPFSYVATTNSILWEGCTPVFADIKPGSFCINADAVERKITEQTEAILATHVYGYPCETDKLERLADRYRLKLIFDAAHSFGCTYNGKSLLNYGDISTCSLHATKIFHTVEGGLIVCKDRALFQQLSLYRSFGHRYDDYFSVGINAKNSELHAAMGLCILPRLQDIIARRKQLFELYNGLLAGVEKPVVPEPDHFKYNYGYYPVVFQSEDILLKVKGALAGQHILTRRYFYPSLNELPFLERYVSCPLSESVSRRVLSLPLYYDLTNADVERICSIINDTLSI